MPTPPPIKICFLEEGRGGQAKAVAKGPINSILFSAFQLVHPSFPFQPSCNDDEVASLRIRVTNGILW